MAKERVDLMRNVGTKDVPLWEKWFAKTVADAVLMSDEAGESQNIKQYVDAKIAELIGGAPATLDTLKEIADYIASHEEISSALEAAIGNKVDKVDGKGLSANDYTNTEKNKLSGIAVGAEVNVQSDWNVTDAASDAYIKNKPLSLPASDVSNWAKAAVKPSYTPTEVGVIDSAPTNGQVPVFDGTGGKIKSSGYILESSVPSGAKFTDTVYDHPSTHPATMIIEDVTHRFATDDEKKNWNSKANIVFASELPSTAEPGTICFLTV